MIAACILVLAAAGTGQMEDVLRQDFRGGKLPLETFSFFAGGPRVAPLVKSIVVPEAAGVRFTLHGKEQPIGIVGFACHPAVPGDFEITLAYEIVHADEPVGGYG